MTSAHIPLDISNVVNVVSIEAYLQKKFRRLSYRTESRSLYTLAVQTLLCGILTDVCHVVRFSRNQSTESVVVKEILRHYLVFLI